MKKHITIILLSIIFLSCEKNDLTYDTITNYRINHFLKDAEISVFDRNSDVTINLNLSKNTEVKSVVVSEYNGTNLVKIADATIASDKTKATFNSSSLGDFNFNGKSTGSYKIAVTSTSNDGNVVNKDYTINVVNPISFSTETASYIYKDTLGVSGKIQPNIIFKTFTLGATVDQVTAEWKIGKLSTIYNPYSATFKVKSDTIKLRELDLFNTTGNYNLVQNDTIYFKFTATSGSITESKTTTVVISPQPMPKSGFGTLSAKQEYFNLSKGENVDFEKDSEVKFIETGSHISFSTIPAEVGPPVVAAIPNRVKFIEITPTSPETTKTLYDNGGAFSAKESYDNGSETSTIALGNEKLFAYKITRKEGEEELDVDYYGYILTSKANIIDGLMVYNFKYKEGTAIVSD